MAEGRGTTVLGLGAAMLTVIVMVLGFWINGVSTQAAAATGAVAIHTGKALPHAGVVALLDERLATERRWNERKHDDSLVDRRAISEKLTRIETMLEILLSQSGVQLPQALPAR